jgi:hypothetical protein
MDEDSHLKTRDMEITFCHLRPELTESIAFFDGSCPSDKSGVNKMTGMEHW